MAWALPGGVWRRHAYSPGYALCSHSTKHVHMLLSLSEMPLPGQFLLVLQESNQASLPLGSSLAIQTGRGTGFFHNELVEPFMEPVVLARVSSDGSVMYFDSHWLEPLLWVLWVTLQPVRIPRMPCITVFPVHLFVSLALLEDGELLENWDCLLTLFPVSGTQ